MRTLHEHDRSLPLTRGRLGGGLKIQSPRKCRNSLLPLVTAISGPKKRPEHAKETTCAR
jgi:hypothetical protein